jgi:hypothetical protein
MDLFCSDIRRAGSGARTEKHSGHWPDNVAVSSSGFLLDALQKFTVRDRLWGYYGFIPVRFSIEDDLVEIQCPSRREEQVEIFECLGPKEARRHDRSTHLMALYFLRISMVFSTGSSSAVWPRPVTEFALNKEL